MRVQHKATRDEIRAERRKRYLESYPIEKQLEAIIEYLMGKNEKLSQLSECFTKIREALPFFKEGD